MGIDGNGQPVVAVLNLVPASHAFFLVALIASSVLLSPADALSPLDRSRAHTRPIHREVGKSPAALGMGRTTTSAAPAPEPLVDTAVDDIPGIVDAVASRAEEWRSVPLDEKIDLLRRILDNAADRTDEWSERGMEARGVRPDDPRHGCGRAELAVSGPATFGSYVNGMISSLEYAARSDGGAPPPPRRTRVVGDGKSVATVFPSGLLEMAEAVGMRGELVLSDPEADQMSYGEAAVGGVAAVLGAGNFDAPTEVLCQMFLKGRVCVYKPNPVNQNTHPVVRRIMEPLENGGYLKFVIGGGEVGSVLVRHPAVDEVVLTGSTATYNKVVWGPTPEEQAKNKEANSPVIDKPVCAELGSVNPWIVVPGRKWTKGAIDRHARHLAFAKLANNGHTCAAPQVVITARDWPQREAFLERVRHWLALYGGSPPFYPGSDEAHAFFGGLAGAEVVAGEGPAAFEGQQRPVLIPGVDTGDAESRESVVLRREAFCPVLSEVPLDCPSGDSMAFLRSAVDFADRSVFGSLTVAVLIDDATVRKNAKEFDRLIADMPFGIVGVNVWPLFANSMPQLLWGAFPGRPESGVGFIGNVGLYRQPEKAVLRAPFGHLGRRVATVMTPKKTDKVYRRLTRYKLQPGFLTQAALLSALFLDI